MNFEQWIKQAYGVDSDDHTARFSVFNMEVAYAAGGEAMIDRLMAYEQEIQYRLDEITRLQTANEELVVALKANQIAEAMTTYGDSSDFVWPKSEMRKPWDTAWGWICEKHGLGYQSGCICCINEFDNYRERKNDDASYARDKALRLASELARKALEKHGGK